MSDNRARVSDDHLQSSFTQGAQEGSSQQNTEEILVELFVGDNKIASHKVETLPKASHLAEVHLATRLNTAVKITRRPAPEVTSPDDDEIVDAEIIDNN